ncbi:MAG: phage portal protein [Carboxydocellales bacterium]
MPIIQRITKFFHEIRSNFATPAQWLIDIFGGRESKAGIRVNANAALRVSAVFACVNLMSQTMASLPLVLYKKLDRGKDRAVNHPIYNLLHYLPNPETTSFDFWVMYIVNLMLTGDAFAYIKRDGNGTILELWNIPSGNVTIYRNRETSEIYYRVVDDYGNQETFYPENIMHTRGMRFNKRDKSIRPIEAARDALGLTIALEEYGSKYFANGANTGGIVKVAGSLSDTAFQRFKESFQEKYAGIGNSSKVLFLEEGTDYVKLGNDPDKSQSLETRKFQIAEVARFFYNIPLHKILDLSGSTNNNIEQQSIDFVQSCVGPFAVRIEQTIYKDLLLPNERKKLFAKFNLNGLLRGDSAARKEFYQAMVQNGVYSPNDVLEKEDENTFEGGDIHMVNGNMIPVELLMEVQRAKLAKGGEISGGNSKD